MSMRVKESTPDLVSQAIFFASEVGYKLGTFSLGIWSTTPVSAHWRWTHLSSS